MAVSPRSPRARITPPKPLASAHAPWTSTIVGVAAAMLVTAPSMTVCPMPRLYPGGHGQPRQANFRWCGCRRWLSGWRSGRQRPRPAGAAARRAERPTRVLGIIRPCIPPRPTASLRPSGWPTTPRPSGPVSWTSTPGGRMGSRGAGREARGGPRRRLPPSPHRRRGPGRLLDRGHQVGWTATAGRIFWRSSTELSRPSLPASIGARLAPLKRRFAPFVCTVQDAECATRHSVIPCP
jgi:hypothetical protein